MPITVFNVQSSRIQDIRLDEGTTVGALKQILHEAGCDVLEAQVTVNRYAQKDKLIGSNDAYVLRDGDTVEFKTKVCSLPAISEEFKTFLATGKAIVGGSGCVPSQAPANVQQERVERSVKAHGLEVIPTADGIVIRIAR